MKMEIWLSGIRQNRLARELNLDETVLSKVINGYRQPSEKMRALLAQYFNKNERWLFQTEPTQPNRILTKGNNGAGSPHPTEHKD
ncbi:MAG: helix-turn-helix transcriptional regulator [Acidobacteriia bacterium]|nr:helix-turn-helix transcriptional regulator [Terriglobia bacterium]